MRSTSTPFQSGWLLIASSTCLTLFFLQTAFAAGEGFVIVTVDLGKIMDGDKVLAKVPKGTRLILVKEQLGWAQVKIPSTEKTGWIWGQEYQLVTDEKAQVALPQALANPINTTSPLGNLFDTGIPKGLSNSTGTPKGMSVEQWNAIQNLKTDSPGPSKTENALPEKKAVVVVEQPAKSSIESGLLGIVTGDPGKIMDGDKVLAEVPKGSRLVIIKEHLGWAEVQVPNSEKTGSILAPYYQRVEVKNEEHLTQTPKQASDNISQKDQVKTKTSEYKLHEPSPEGPMGIVTGNPGKIMDGNKILAEVPNGTRLWIFSVDKNWVEVKVPNDELHGWIASMSLDPLILTESQQAEEKEYDALIENAASHRQASRFEEAFKSMEMSLIIARRIYGEHPNTALSLTNLYILAFAKKDLPTARKYIDEALAIDRKFLGNNHPNTALHLQSLGALAQEEGDILTARKFYEDSLVIQRKILGNYHPNTAQSINSLGTLAMDQGDYPTAEKLFEEALEIYRKILGTDDQGMAGTLNNLGALARMRKEFPVAKKYFEEVIAINRKQFGYNHPDTVGALVNLGNLAFDQGDSSTAKKSYTEALAIQQKFLGKDHPTTATILHNIGVLANLEKEYDTARKLCTEALTIQRKVLGNDHTSTTLTLNNLAAIANNLGDYSSARSYFDDARRGIRMNVRKVLPGLSEAEQVLFLDFLYLSDLTDALSFGWINHDEAEVANASAVWLMNGKSVAQEALATRMILARDAKNPSTAVLVNELTEVRRQLAVYSMSVPEKNQVDTRQAQLSKLMSQEGRITRMLSQTTGTIDASRDWFDIEDIRKNLAADETYFDLVRMNIYNFKERKYSSPHYLAWIISANKNEKIEILDLGEAEQIDQAIEQVRALLANASDSKGTLRQEGEAVANKEVTKKLQAVADLVLKPLIPHLAEKKELILSPDGALWLLPWAALPVSENKCLLEQCSIRYVTSGRDLVKKSGTSKLGTTAPAIVVNPDYDLIGTAAKTAMKTVMPETKFDETESRSVTSRSSLPRVAALPFTSLEGTAAKPSLAQLSKSTPIFYEQEKALEAVVKKFQRPKQLLLSTHGFFLPDQEVKRDDKQDLLASNDSNRPRSVALTTDGKPVENPLLRCGLLFAGCNAERTPGLDDGILTGLEIVGMDLRGTELVVLSACETGIGKVRNGEGVAGLRQAFQLAGAQSVVSTLWQVPDRDSALIMQDFFTNLAAGQTKADALRNSQLKRIEARKEKSGAAHPFFWAAWTVTGD